MQRTIERQKKLTKGSMSAARYHIIIDITDISDKKLNDTEGLEAFLNELPGTIGMTILHGPTVIEGVPANPGVTGFVIIDFSHISVHTFSATSQVFVDIFSCKEYDQEDALKTTLAYFEGQRENAHIQTVHWGK